MPTSDPTQISTILSGVLELQPATVLDVGVGHGKMGPLLREYLPAIRRLDGIEPWPQAIFPGNLLMYDEVRNGAFPEQAPPLPAYDLVLMIDVIEHYTIGDGVHALQAALRLAPHVLVATPRRFSEQGAVGGNEYERHKSLWTPLDFFTSTAAGVDVREHPDQLIVILSRTEPA